MKYTYDDIIINPEDKRLEGAIGKKVYLDSSAIDVLKQANGEDGPNILMAIHKDVAFPFQGIMFRYPFVILKKEPEVKYVPFDLSKEEDRDFLRDKWVRHKERHVEFVIREFSSNESGKWNTYCCSAKNLFKNFTFLDGTPVGKKVEE